MSCIDLARSRKHRGSCTLPITFHFASKRRRWEWHSGLIVRLAQYLPSQFCASARRTPAQGLEPCSKERRDIACEELGLFGGSEVRTAGHRCPLTDIVETFGPLTRRGAIGDELVSEDGDRRWHRDEIPRAKRDSVPPGIEVVSDRGRDGLRRPVHHDGGEQFILPETTLQVAIAVTPRAELLHDPGGQTNRRVVQPVGERLRLGGLNRFVAAIHLGPVLILRQVHALGF